MIWKPASEALIDGRESLSYQTSDSLGASGVEGEISEEERRQQTLEI